MRLKASHFLIGASAFLAAGCASQAGGPVEDWLQLETPVTVDNSAPEQGEPALSEPALERQEAETERRSVPRLTAPTGTARPGMEAPDLPDDRINVTLPPQPVPAFVNTVFGDILEQPFSLGPGVSEREELVSLRSVRDMEPDVFLSLVETALRDYGLGVSYQEGLFRVVELEELRAQMPRFITSRAHSDVPTGLRPVVQFVELVAIDAGDMQPILEQAFPDRGQLTIRNNRRTNSLVLSGLADEVNAALAIIEEMDELRFAGTQVITYMPVSWDASEMASAVADILTLEGFMIGLGTREPRAITLLPLDYTNQMMIFASNAQQAEYVLSVARRLDEDAFRGEAESAHVYQVVHAEASVLAEVVSSVIGSGQPAGAQAAATSSSEDGEGQSTGGSGAVVSGAPRLTVDEQGNRLVYFGTQAEYDRLLNLLRQLDTPVPEVLIEVTIAEVTLNDDSSYGLDVIFDSELVPDFTASLSSGGGFSGTVRTGQVSLDGSANSSSNQVNVLSTPRLVTRSGASASIQVGTDVPIITSQRASNAQTGGSTDFLQTVQYRSTGILLSVEPRVYSGDRIDLTISQEVSAAQENGSSDISSPLISNRSLNSQLSLQDGQTAVLGGLIENRFDRNHSGVPFIKDLPILGAPFRNVGLSATRTMLVVLVTPYVLDTRDDRQQVVDALVGAVNRGFTNAQGRSRTLLPPSQPMQIRPAGGGAAQAPAEAGDAAQ